MKILHYSVRDGRGEPCTDVQRCSSCSPEPMGNAARIRAYARDNHQTGRFAATPAQRRRINKLARKGSASA